MYTCNTKYFYCISLYYKIFKGIDEFLGAIVIDIETILYKPNYICSPNHIPKLYQK